MKKYEEIVQEWQKRDIITSYDVEACLENFCILFAYHSNVI